MNYNYITDFFKSREGRIGASEVAACIPHPEKPTESIAGYEQTAITVYEQKIGLTKRDPAGFAADMGNYLEPIILREFIKDFTIINFADKEKLSKHISDKFYKGYILCELEKINFPDAKRSTELFNYNSFKHHTESINEFGVAHSDCLYIPDIEMIKMLEDQKIKYVIEKDNLKIDFSKPFLIEAKSAQYFTVKTREKDIYKGYDLELKEWQGIPLKHYFQIQFQLALYNVDVCYLALLYNTSEKHYWTIKKNKKIQNELLEIASYMKQCIDKKTPPKKLALNSMDIIKLYPKIKEDFIEITGPELDQALKIRNEFKEAKDQELIWKNKKIESENAMSILLKDNEEIKGISEGELISLAKWKKTGGNEYIIPLSEIKNDKRLFNYIKKNNLIKEQKKNRKPNIIIKDM